MKTGHLDQFRFPGPPEYGPFIRKILQIANNQVLFVPFPKNMAGYLFRLVYNLKVK